MKESGEKGGTADMNIGVGELQECTISKDMDSASTQLAQFAINGNSPGVAEIDFVEVAGGGETTADSYSFGVEREMKESGEKGGTADINIGVGELQECTISKSMDSASTQLAQFAINGNSPGQAEIEFVEVAGDRTADTDPETRDLAFAELDDEASEYKLDSCSVKSWSISGDADDRPTEEVAFYYNRF